MSVGTIEPEIPNTPNTVGDSWQPFLSGFLTGRQGDNHVSLTEWSSSTVVPQVASGSSIEVNGSLVTYNSNTPLVDDTGLSSGTVYLLIDISDAINAFPTLVNDVPVWNAAKNGFYRGANERYTGHQMTWNGATLYTEKELFEASTYEGLLNRRKPDGTSNAFEAEEITSGSANIGTGMTISTDGSITAQGSSGYGPKSSGVVWFNSTNPWYPPAGMYNLIVQNGRIELYVSGSWVGAETGFGIVEAGTLISDGSNMRCNRTDGAGGGVYYQKIY